MFQALTSNVKFSLLCPFSQSQIPNLATTLSKTRSKPMYDLTKHLQNLLIELYHIIYELVFTPTSELQKLDEKLVFSAQPHVSKASRNKFGSRFYGSSETDFEFRDLDIVTKWLGVLDLVHRAMPKKTRYLNGNDGYIFCRPFAWSRMFSEIMVLRLSKHIRALKRRLDATLEQDPALGCPIE